MIEISLKLRIGRRRPRPTADPAPPYVEDGPTSQAELDGEPGRWPELHGDAHGWSEPDEPEDRPRKVGFCR